MKNMRPLLSFDIETIPQKELTLYPNNIRAYIEKKVQAQIEKNPDFDYNYYASIDGDFGKAICISMATYDQKRNEIKTKSFYGDDEAEILIQFRDIIEKHQGLFLHYNGLYFDVPFLLKRFAYHNIQLNSYIFKNLRKFSADPHFDLYQQWANWDYSRGKSLEVLAYLHDVPSPKDILSGDKVFDTYKQGDWKTIVKYCEYDSATVLNLYLKIYQNLTVFKEDQYRTSTKLLLNQ